VDVGGLSTGFGASGLAADPWMEGLQLDHVRIMHGGEPDEQIMRMIRDNIRYPESSMGDLRAQIAACRLGERRIAELAGRYGLDQLDASVKRIFRDSEERARRAVEALADGDYVAEAAIDHDFVDRDDPVRIKATVRVRGSEMEIDLSECSPQRRGAVNSRTRAAAFVAFKALTSPREAVNQGSFAALKVTIAEGTFMMAAYPAPMASWSTPVPTVVDTILRAISGAAPEQIPAAHFGTLGAPMTFFGTNPGTGRRFVVQSIEGGGWGGRPHQDGMSGSVSVCQGDVRNAPIEGLEMKFPIRVVHVPPAYRRMIDRPDGSGRSWSLVSAQYQVAARLLHPQDLFDCVRPVLGDSSAFRRLMGLVHVHEEGSLAARHPQSYPALVAVALRSGTTERYLSDGRSPSPRWNWAPLLTKPRAVAVHAGAEERIDPLREAISGFTDSGELTRAALPAIWPGRLPFRGRA
ncbi:MAG: hydantoinase B/oxoprolinase family protein, partial [Trebonia sp.]